MRHPWPFKIWLPWFHHLPLPPVTCRHECSVVADSLWPRGLEPARLLCLWDYPGKSTGVGCHFLLQGIFLTQGLNWDLLHCRWILYHWGIGEVPLPVHPSHIRPYKALEDCQSLQTSVNAVFSHLELLQPHCSFSWLPLIHPPGLSWKVTFFWESFSSPPLILGEDCHSSYCRIVWFPVYYSVSPTES